MKKIIIKHSIICIALIILSLIISTIIHQYVLPVPNREEVRSIAYNYAVRDLKIENCETGGVRKSYGNVESETKWSVGVRHKENIDAQDSESWVDTNYHYYLICIHPITGKVIAAYDCLNIYDGTYDVIFE